MRLNARFSMHAWLFMAHGSRFLGQGGWVGPPWPCAWSHEQWNSKHASNIENRHTKIEMHSSGNAKTKMGAWNPYIANQDIATNSAWRSSQNENRGLGTWKIRIPRIHECGDAFGCRDWRSKTIWGWCDFSHNFGIMNIPGLDIMLCETTSGKHSPNKCAMRFLWF